MQVAFWAAVATAVISAAGALLWWATSPVFPGVPGLALAALGLAGANAGLAGCMLLLARIAEALERAEARANPPPRTGRGLSADEIAAAERARRG
jgi:hypothetical protein